jgi:hypothetical protein
LENEFQRKVRAVVDLVSLPNFHIYVRLMVDGEVTPPLSGKTLEPDSIEPQAR